MPDIRHKQLHNNDSSTVLLPGEIAYTDSNTIKVGDGVKTFSQLPEFSSNASIVDNATISNTNTNKLQALGTINKNSESTITAAFDWIGTQEEYELQDIETEHPDWVCYILDDLSSSASENVYSKAETDALLDQKANGVGTAVLTTGEQYIEGNKSFKAGTLRSKSDVIEYGVQSDSIKYLQMVMGQDKNGQRISILETNQDTTGEIGCYIASNTYVNNSPVYSPIIGTYISQDGQTSRTYCGKKPAVTDNDGQIATTGYVMDVLKTIYPVGSVYIGTQSTCPMASLFGTWSLVSSGRALWTGTGSNGNSTIAAGLPNITGQFIVDDQVAGTGSGAFYNTGTAYNYDASSSGGNARYLGFSAQNSNSIYGNSSTVQPPAYVVNVWRRTA